MKTSNNPINAAFIRTIGGQLTGDPVLVKFAGRANPIEYSADIMNLIITDPATEYIMHALTGEILFSK